MIKKIALVCCRGGSKGIPKKNIKPFNGKPLLYWTYNNINKSKLFDNIFLSIEYHIRELGYGDVAVNKKMKLLLRIFYDVLLKIRSTKSKKKINKAILAKYLEPQNTNPNQLNDELANYFEEFYNFCFEIKNNSMLKGQINFKYKK